MKKLDYTLILIVLLIFGLGLVFQYSASYQKGLLLKDSPLFKQIIWMGLAILVCIGVLCIGYHKILSIAPVLYAISILLLILVLVFGPSRLGAQRWISLGIFNIQPSEFTKLAFILVMAHFLGHRKTGEVLNLKDLFVCICLTVLPMLLILKEPDLGTSVLFLPILFCMLYIGGAPIRNLLTLLAIGLATTPFLWHILKGYQRQRLLVFVDPNIDPLGAGYTVIQSKIAMGSGGLFGKGWLAGTQSQLNFLTERHTDFIFSVVGEEWGLAGCLILLVLYFLLIRRALGIASRSNDPFGKIMVVGIVAMLGFQIVINMGMTIGLFPVVGLTLPLISYGGSSLFVVMLSLTLVLDVDKRVRS